MTEKSKPPVFEAKHRQIRASVFLNHDKNGREFYNTQLVRRYKNRDDDWCNTSQFTGEEDLILAKSLIEKVLDFIRTNSRNEAA